ncbi:daz associated protein 1 [Echinococcus multilocularis]|uniref:Daz associated protein 1 n=1 Tax=Echinococcus multilocularis TaxID=6211 RepID=A0A068YCE8_ECHMU|nr:daz associated protein 1 [Echinococcus multilocularis]
MSHASRHHSIEGGYDETMASTDADLTCGVCAKLISDPYSLPCGHTFCLRPCLLSHARAVTARCIHCHVEYDAADLRPNYAIGAQLCMLSLQRREEQERTQNQMQQSGGTGEEEMLIDRKEIKETPPTYVCCSTCRRQIQIKLLTFCHHCHRQVCVNCHERHRDTYSLRLRVKLNVLSRHKANLISRLVELNKLKTSMLGMGATTKEGTFGAMENAIMELRSAASKALEAATANVEVTDVAGFEILDELVSRITNLSAEVSKAKDVQTSIEETKDLQEAVKMHKSLERLLVDAAPLGEMMKKLPPLPITKMNLSDRFEKINHHLSDFSLVVCDGVLSLPQLLRLSPRCDTGDQKNVTLPITAMTTSRVKLHVGGLRPNHTEGQLRQHFAQYGTVVDCCIVRDCNTDESRGFGFVTFREAAQATRALADRLHFIDGGPVRVSPYNLKKKKKEEKLVVSSSVKNEGDENVGHKNEGGGSRSRRDVDELRLFVGNLSTSTGQQALKEYFSRYGNVTSVNIILERKSGMPRRIAFVNMSTPQEVEAVLEARPHQLSGETIIVRPAYSQASKLAKAF